VAIALLGCAGIKAEIARREKQKLERLDVKSDHVFEGLRRIAFCGPLDFMADGQFRRLEDIPWEARTCLASWDVHKNGRLPKPRIKNSVQIHICRGKIRMAGSVTGVDHWFKVYLHPAIVDLLCVTSGTKGWIRQEVLVCTNQC
jgi:hypothetical protein